MTILLLLSLKILNKSSSTWFCFMLAWTLDIYRCSLTYNRVTYGQTHPKLKISQVKNAFNIPKLLHIIIYPSLPDPYSKHLTLAYSWAISICVSYFLLFFSPETRDTDILQTWPGEKTQYTLSKNAGNTVHYRVSVVYPVDCLASRELQLAASVQHQKSV